LAIINLSARNLVAICAVISLLSSCEFYHGKDYVAEGLAQDELFEIIQSIALIEEIDSAQVVELSSNTGKGPTYWFKIIFDPSDVHAIQLMLKSNGYIPTQSGSFAPIEPSQNLTWWTPNEFTKESQMILKDQQELGSYDRAWCILSLEKGEMLGWAISP